MLLTQSVKDSFKNGSNVIIIHNYNYSNYHLYVLYSFAVIEHSFRAILFIERYIN